MLAQFLPMQILNRYQFTKGNDAFKNKKHMSLVQTYLDNNGYDYYGNAAEDTLVFFVREEQTPLAKEPISSSNEIIKKLAGDKVNNSTTFVNTKTHAKA